MNSKKEGVIIKFNVCPMCRNKLVSTEYKGISVCDDCFIELKIKSNVVENKNLEDNTFTVKRNCNTHIGLIMGYQHRTGDKGGDKYYVHMNVNQDNYSIWYDSWVTEKDLVKMCENYKINVEKLLR